MYLKFRSLLFPILLFNASLYACGGESKNIVEKNESSFPQFTQLDKDLQKLILKHSFTDLDIADRLKQIATLRSVCKKFKTLFLNQDFRSDILSGCMGGVFDSLGAYLADILFKKTRTHEEESFLQLMQNKPSPHPMTIFNHFYKFCTTIAGLKENPCKAKAYISLLPLLCWTKNYSSYVQNFLAEIIENRAFEDDFHQLVKEIKKLTAMDKYFDNDICDSSFITDQLPKLIQPKLSILNPHCVFGLLSALGREYGEKNSDCAKRVIGTAQMLLSRILSDFLLTGYKRKILEAAQSGDLSIIKTFIQNNHTYRTLGHTKDSYLNTTLLTELALLGSLLNENDEISVILADALLEVTLEPTACNEHLITLILCTALLHKQEYVAHKLWNVYLTEWPRKSSSTFVTSCIQVTSQDRDSFSCTCDLLDAVQELLDSPHLPRNLWMAIFDNDLEAIEEQVGTIQDPMQLKFFYVVSTVLAGAQQNTALLSYISSRSPIGLHEVLGLKSREWFRNDTHCVTSVISAEMIKAELDNFMQGDTTALLEDDAVSRFLRRFTITENMLQNNPLIWDLYFLHIIEQDDVNSLHEGEAYFIFDSIDLQNQEYNLDQHLRLLSWAIMKGLVKNCNEDHMMTLWCHYLDVHQLQNPEHWFRTIVITLYSDCLTFATPTLQSMNLLYKVLLSNLDPLSQEWLVAAWKRSKEELIKHMPPFQEETTHPATIAMLLLWAAPTGRIELVEVLMDNAYAHSQILILRDAIISEARAFGHEALAEFLEALHDENENEGE